MRGSCVLRAFAAGGFRRRNELWVKECYDVSLKSGHWQCGDSCWQSKLPGYVPIWTEECETASDVSRIPISCIAVAVRSLLSNGVT
jgi:hypothetical protein